MAKSTSNPLSLATLPILGQPLSPVRGILFDKDGTLIDFNSAWIPAGIETAKQLCTLAKLPQCLEDLLAAAGYQGNSLSASSKWACGTTRGLLTHWIETLGLQGRDGLLEECLQFMTEAAQKHSEPVTDLPLLFDELRTQGCQLGVATMDLEQSATTILERFGAREAIDFVCGCDSGYGLKPGPGMALAFCATCGLQPDEILVIGDTPHDLQMGRAAGAGRVVAVASGFSGRDQLELEADYLLESISQLPALLDRLL
ncbi:MAG TPA: HAD family hydrolase [Gammaproteobacteria bacterium]|nr:HAD family hydrolase [Gammaproteobacteria bacterium]